MTKLLELIESASRETKIEVDLIASIIYKESGGDVWAHRYEPAFYNKYIEPLTRQQLSGYVPESIPTLETEKRDRAYSFGLCQILGETARSKLHVNHDNLSELFNPELNVILGATYLAMLKVEYRWLSDPEEMMRAVVRRYNGKGEAARIYQESVYNIKECLVWETIMDNEV